MADDTTVIGKPEDAAAAFLTLQSKMKLVNLYQNADKCYAFSAQRDASSLPLPAGTTPDNGLVQLGAPTGKREFMENYVAKKLKRPMAIMRALQHLQDGARAIGLNILRSSLLPRVRYLLSVVPLGVGQTTFDAWDALVKETAAKLSDEPQTDPMFFVAAKLAGLGLWLIADHRAQIYLRAKDRALRAARKHFPQLSEPLDAARKGDAQSATGRALQAAHALLPATVRLSTPTLAELSSLDDSKARKACADLKAAMAKHVAQLAKAGMSHKRLLILAGSARPGTSAFLTAAPTYKRFYMEDAEFIAALRIRLGLPHAQLRGLPSSGDCLGREVIRAKGKARLPHDALLKLFAGFSKEAGRLVDTEVPGLFGKYPNQADDADKKGEGRRVDMVEHDIATGESTMTDNFITDGAGSGASLTEPLTLLKNAEKKKIKKYVDGTGPQGYKFIPLGVGVQGEMTETTSKWLAATALSAAKRQSDDPVVIGKLRKRIQARFVQQMSVTLMKAQAKMIIDHVVNARRGQYLTAPPRRRRAANGRARGPAAGRFRAGGSRGPAPRAGHGR